MASVIMSDASSDTAPRFRVGSLVVDGASEEKHIGIVIVRYTDEHAALVTCDVFWTHMEAVLHGDQLDHLDEVLVF